MAKESVDTRQKSQDAYTMPVIVRARGYYVYDRFGRRYIDFFQNHGRAILGHRPDGFTRTMKSTASRGLFADYPSVYQGRLEKILAALLPGYQVVRIYRASGTAERALNTRAVDPAFQSCLAQCSLAYWRPFIGDPLQSKMLLPILPFPGSFIPEIVCAKSEDCARELPPSEAVSPLLLDLLVKTVSALVQALKDEEVQQSRIHHPFQSFGKVNGPYLLTGLDDACYREFWKEALAIGILLPPDSSVPIIVPGDFTDGDVKGFITLLERFVP